MQPVKFKSRKFVCVDPDKCTGCGICEYACTLEKDEKVWKENTPHFTRIFSVGFIGSPVIRLLRALDNKLQCIVVLPEPFFGHVSLLSGKLTIFLSQEPILCQGWGKHLGHFVLDVFPFFLEIQTVSI